MKKQILILLLTLISVTATASAEITAIKGKVTDGYNFWLYTPKVTAKSDSIANDSTVKNTDERQLQPLIIFLHGQSLCGTNMNKVLKYGTMSAIEKGKKIDAYVVAPQNPGGSWKPSKIASVMDWAIANCKVDTTRIYVLGMSLGGYGTIDFVATYPERIAAAMALCGGGTKKDYSGLNNVPLWIIHGTADRAVSVNESRKVVNAMKSYGKTPLLRYDEWSGVNHGRLARLFYLDETYQWLMQHSLSDNPRQVNTEIEITNQSLNSAYKGLKHNTKKKKSKKSKKSSKKKKRKK